jgi:hypothetical protein
MIREALQQHQYSSFESLYDDRVRPAFHRLDDLLTAATDRYLVNPRADISYEDIKQAYDDSRNCGYALINLVFLEVSSKQYVGKSGQPIRSRSVSEIDCPLAVEGRYYWTCEAGFFILGW